MTDCRWWCRGAAIQRIDNGCSRSGAVDPDIEGCVKESAVDVKCRVADQAVEIDREVLPAGRGVQHVAGPGGLGKLLHLGG